MKAPVLVLAFVLALSACSRTTTQPQRVTLVKKGPTSFELVPAEGQPPYCHVFTVSSTGATQHHTLFDDKLSPNCPAGVPVAGMQFRVYASSRVKVYVIFSDRPLESLPLTNQFQDLVSQNQPITAMDLRAPGRVVVETIDFIPGAP